MTFFPTLETPRLRLRRLVAADAPALLAMHADAESRRWAGYNAIRDLEGALDFVNWADQLAQRPVPGFCWAIERKDVPGVIGQCNFTHCDAAALSAALGYELAPPYQGQGFMNEAVGRVLNWCFLHLQLMRISATVHPDNVPSIRMLQRWEFQREGLLRSAGFWGGRHHDLLSFSLLATEFAPAYARQVQERSAAAAAAVCAPAMRAELAEA